MTRLDPAGPIPFALLAVLLVALCAGVDLSCHALKAEMLHTNPEASP